MPDFAHRIPVFRVILFAINLLIGTGCAELQTELATRPRELSDALKTALTVPHARPVYWHGDSVDGPPKIVIHLGEQRAFFYKGKHLVGESNISTGRQGFETPPGKYSVIQKDEYHVSNLYGDYVNKDGEVVERNVDISRDPQPAGTEFVGAQMPYFLRFTRGYGMHAGFVPRYRASHGCIRMPTDMAKHFFEHAKEDTPVIVEK